MNSTIVRRLLDVVLVAVSGATGAVLLSRFASPMRPGAVRDVAGAIAKGHLSASEVAVVLSLLAWLDLGVLLVSATSRALAGSAARHKAPSRHGTSWRHESLNRAIVTPSWNQNAEREESRRSFAMMGAAIGDRVGIWRSSAREVDDDQEHERRKHGELELAKTMSPPPIPAPSEAVSPALEAARLGDRRTGALRANRTRLQVHLEESEWSRLAVGLVAASGPDDFTIETTAPGVACLEVVELHPDEVIVHLAPIAGGLDNATLFSSHAHAWEWSLPRSPEVAGSLPVTPRTLRATRLAGLVTVSERDGRRTLLDVVAAGTTQLVGPPTRVGTKIADVAAELALRRWSDLETVVLVGFGEALHGLEGARFAPDVAAGLDEIALWAIGRDRGGACVIVPPWACAATDPLLEELFRHAKDTEGLGVVCCDPPEPAQCVWDVGSGGSLAFSDGRELEPLAIRLAAAFVVSSSAPSSVEVCEPEPEPTVPAISVREPEAAGPPISVAVEVLGPVRIDHSSRGFGGHPRLTELVTYLAMHRGGATSEAFSTALWPDRRIPTQTVSNRLCEARRALGLAPDGLPRLRRSGARHLLVDVDTDWDRYRELSSESYPAPSWQAALELVRGRPFEGLSRGEWVHLEGFAIAIEAAVVGVACRLGTYSLERARPELAEWAGQRALLVAPWDERLHRLLMRSADAMGNRGGVEAAMRSLAQALELDGDPLDGVHPETAALYRRLTSSPRRD